MTNWPIETAYVKNSFYIYERKIEYQCTSWCWAVPSLASFGLVMAQLLFMSGKTKLPEERENNGATL